MHNQALDVINQLIINQALDVINQLIISHQTDMEFKSKVGKPWYEVADHLDREDVMLSP